MKLFIISRVGPTKNAAIVTISAKIKFKSDTLFIPLSTPDTAVAINTKVVMAIIIIWVIELLGILNK